jgi:two-component system, OmpR family, sensor histidine kinase PhoQ
MASRRIPPPNQNDAIVARIRLTSRFLLTTTLVLATCLALSAWVLDRAFATSVIASAEEQLTLVVYGLLGAADDTGEGLTFPDTLPEPRLSQPESGLYAVVLASDDEPIFASTSLRLTDLETGLHLQRGTPGDALFYTNGAHFYLSYAVLWDGLADDRYDFVVIADREPFQARINDFRRQMTFGAIAVIGLLALAQYLAVLWGLGPIHRMAHRVRQLEAGSTSRMGDDHPAELTPLARNIDRFIDHEAATRERYRQSMADLAHSLKTPLAVLRNGLNTGAGRIDVPLLADQVARMQSTIDYQLARAVAAPRLLPAAVIDVVPVAERLLAALDKAYANRDVRAQLRVDGAASPAVRADERDLMEMLGNLLDNAYKYCRGQVRVTVHDEDPVRIAVCDDGPGIAPEFRADVVARGARADTRQPGQGLGLAVTAELAAGYGGTVDIGDGPLGGACVTLSLPRAARTR